MPSRIYNGLPLFDVDICDFSYVVECVTLGKKMLSRNISDPELKKYFDTVRKAKFAASYGGTVIIYGR
jgi:hypothetical protein